MMMLGIIINVHQKRMYAQMVVADLEQRTGVSIVHLEIGKVDLLRDTANIKIHFAQGDDPGHYEEQNA